MIRILRRSALAGDVRHGIGSRDLRRDRRPARSHKPLRTAVAAVHRPGGHLVWRAELRSKRIASELGCARNTVRCWLAEGDWRTCTTASRSKKLDELSDWIAERFHRHV